LTELSICVLVLLFVVSLYWGFHHQRRKTEILSIITSFNRGQETIYNLTELSKYILKKFLAYMGGSRGALFIYHRQRGEIRLAGSIGLESTEQFPPLLVGRDALTWVLGKRKGILTMRDLNDSEFEAAFPSLRERLKKESLETLIPIKERNLLFGFIALGGEKQRKISSDILNPLLSLAEHGLESFVLYESSITDETTGLYNKRFFLQSLQTELRRSDRYHQPCTLLAFDLDDFKQVNDQFGHPQGDRVLKELGALIHECIRDGIDIPARTGGEEFHVILPATDSERAMKVAERLRNTVSNHHFAGLNRQVTLSLGLAGYPAHADEEGRLVLLADQSLYLAKSKGKNLVCVAGELETADAKMPAPHSQEQIKLINPETLLFRSDYFLVRLKEEIKRSIRYQFPCSLVVFAVETSPTGSSFEAIRKFSPILREHLRTGIDTPAALDRECIAVIMPETEKDKAVIMAERMQRFVEDFTLSAGISGFPADALTDEALITCAKKALAEAQKQGPNHLVLFESERFPVP